MKKQKLLHCVVDTDKQSGIGRISFACLKEFQRLNVPIEVKSCTDIPGYREENFVHCDIVTATQRRVLPNSVLMTYVETDRTDPKYVPILNTYRAIIVSSQWSKKSMQMSGVKAPIHVVPLGVNLDVYYPELYKLPEQCVFLTAANIIPGMTRKNIDFLIHAFLLAFPHEQDVVLRIKTTESSEYVDTLKSPRIQEIRQFLNEKDMVRLYRESLAFVSPSKSEGFGLHGLEALACGKPLISTYYSGETEYFKPKINGYRIEHKIEKAYDVFYRCGNWAQLDMHSLIEQLRFVYNNRVDALLMGLQGRQSIMSFNEQNMAQEVLKVLNKYSE